MAFASTIESRPNVMGNLMMVTGTFTNGGSDAGGNIDLSGLLANIVACGANAGSSTAGTGAGVDGVFALINGTTLVIQNVNGQDGTWFAMGNRS
jgi:hypothetical protein|tara:strand:- start:949 stop:1230 length:282 start_codon:yes stop_codon:yes gene_type:complete